MSDESPWNEQDAEAAKDLIERIGDGFDWQDGDEYLASILLQRALKEIERLGALARDRHSARNAEAAFVEQRRIVMWLRRAGLCGGADDVADAIEQGKHYAK